MSHRKNSVGECDFEKVTHYIEQFGNSASLSLFHPLCKFFNDPAIEGVIGYRMEQNCIVAFGDPICGRDDRMPLAKAFHDYCKELNKTSIYLMASESFTSAILHNFGGSALQFGHDIILDPTIDLRTLTGSYPHHLRQKFRNAISSGLSVLEYKGDNQEIEQTLIDIAQQWVVNRKGPQIYLIPIDVFAHRSSKRWFYAEKDGQIVGFLMLNKINGSEGWALNGSIMLTAQAPKSTSEFLMLTILELLRGEGCIYFSAGPMMALEIERMEGFGWFSQLFIDCSMKSARKLFRMQDRQRYWKKFHPKKEPLFVTLTTSRMGLYELRAILRACNLKIKFH